MEISKQSFIDLIKFPICTEKTILLLQQNQYSFAVDPKARKSAPEFHERLERERTVRERNGAFGQTPTRRTASERKASDSRSCQTSG